MAFNKRQSEAAVLEQYRVSLENVKKQPKISSTMTEYGYTPESITIGENLYSSTLQVYQLNKTEDDETSTAYQLFDQNRVALTDIYRIHRRKAKAAFRKDPVMLDQLSVSGSQPGVYVKWMVMVKKFYAEASNSEETKTKLSRFKVTDEEISMAINLISQTEAARSEYLREVGESEDATKQKDAAFTKLDDWMGEFYEVAKIALEDHPQLLEALGLSVRS